MTAKERIDTSTRQADLFDLLVGEVVIHDGDDRLVVAKLERDPGGCLWLTRLLGKRALVCTIELAKSDMYRIALAYNGKVIWNDTSGEKTTVRGPA